MRIVLKSNFDVAEVFNRGTIEVEDGTRLSVLLEILSEQSRIDLVSAASGQPHVTDYAVMLNGKEPGFCPEGLRTVLKDGDEVQIVVLPLGGG